MFVFPGTVARSRVLRMLVCVRQALPLVGSLASPWRARGQASAPGAPLLVLLELLGSAPSLGVLATHGLIFSILYVSDNRSRACLDTSLSALPVEWKIHCCRLIPKYLRNSLAHLATTAGSGSLGGLSGTSGSLVLAERGGLAPPGSSQLATSLSSPSVVRRRIQALAAGSALRRAQQLIADEGAGSCLSESRYCARKTLTP